MTRHFNTGGPCRPEKHYMLPAAERFAGARRLIDLERYFVLHAPRQTGKSTTIAALAANLNAEGCYAALLVSCEEAQAAGEDINRGIGAILKLIEDRAATLAESLRPPPLASTADVDGVSRLRTCLMLWAERSPRPVVLFLDEIDSIIGRTLISVLRQIRAGYPDRPQRFPQTVALIGMRDVRDYKIAQGEVLHTSSPYNVKDRSFLLANFTAEDVATLLQQHTDETGQLFSDEVKAGVFELTRGQPWLVNALARQLVEDEVPDPHATVELHDLAAAKLDEADLLYLVVRRFHEVDLHPDTVKNHTMGLIFEDLIRRFNEALDENPGEHFTPRDVVRLMARLMIEPDKKELRTPYKTKTICDPCCGTGGMLTVAQGLIKELSDTADVHLYGQEVNPQTFAVTKSDLFLSTPSGREAANVFFGSALSNDRHDGTEFDYLLANPPYGKDWKRDQDAVRDEHALGEAGRFAPGLPRISDGQTLFLMHMVHHMKRPENGGSRVLIIMNGSPLFTGDAGSGESEIRRWLMERDLVEAIVALPEQLFYNTGIATYVWVISNRKPRKRRGKVQLINASGEDFWKPMRKSLGDKRREISPEQIDEIVRIYNRFEDDGVSKIFAGTDFGYRKITVERPLRLTFRITEERIAALEQEKAFQSLAVSRKKGEAGRRQVEEGQEMQEAILQVLSDLASDEVRRKLRRCRPRAQGPRPQGDPERPLGRLGRR